MFVLYYIGGLEGVATMLILYPDEEMVGVAMTNKGGGQNLAPMVMYTAENIYDLVK